MTIPLKSTQMFVVQRPKGLETNYSYIIGSKHTGLIEQSNQTEYRDSTHETHSQTDTNGIPNQDSKG